MRIILSVVLAFLIWRDTGAVRIVAQAVRVVGGNWGGAR